MRSEPRDRLIAVFDIGGTWFRWGLYDPVHGLVDSARAPAINYLSYPGLSAVDLQEALVDFIAQHVRDARKSTDLALDTIGISLGAPVNAHDLTVLGSGPLWGPSARPFDLQARLGEALPGTRWHIVNDITALLAPYMDDGTACKKTMLITVSSGIGSRLYDHQNRRIPYDREHGVQGEIGHLVCSFELGGQLIARRCECGGWNHINAFSSGRGIAQTLLSLPSLNCDSTQTWRDASDEYRLSAFNEQLDQGNPAAMSLLDALVTPLLRTLAAAVCLDPDLDRIVMTGGVVHGLGRHYREGLQRTLLRDGLYQITERDPHYLTRRLCWEEKDDFAGLKGMGIYATQIVGTPEAHRYTRS